MTRRQTVPEQWLIVAGRMDHVAWARLRRLPHGTGVVLLDGLGAQWRRRLRHLQRLRGLAAVAERPGTAARVHDRRELRRALQLRTPLILLSPVHETRSHRDWRPIPRMRAATLARLAGRRLLALGGMNARRYATLAPLGFIGWAGISAWERR